MKVRGARALAASTLFLLAVALVAGTALGAPGHVATVTFLFPQAISGAPYLHLVDVANLPDSQDSIFKVVMTHPPGFIIDPANIAPPDPAWNASYEPAARQIAWECSQDAEPACSSTIPPGSVGFFDIMGVWAPNVSAMTEFNWSIETWGIDSATDAASLGDGAPYIAAIYVEPRSLTLMLFGDNPAEITIGSTYVDAGATAFDTYDGDITPGIITQSNVDTSVLGQYAVNYTVTNTAGDIATAQRVVNVVADLPADGTPVTTATLVDAFGAPWGACAIGAWCTSIPTSPYGLYVKLNCAGDCGATYYCQSGPNCTPNIAYTMAGPFQHGIFHVRYYTVNNAGGANESVKTSVVMVDTAPPLTSASALKADGTDYVFNTATNQSVNATLSCSDYPSGCQYTLYCMDTGNACVPGTSYSAPVQVSSPGTTYLRYASVDSAGNVEAAGSQAIQIGNPPVTAATAMTSQGSGYAFFTWTNASYVNVTLACSDPAGPGCDATLYCVTPEYAPPCAPSTVYTGPVQIGGLSIPARIVYMSNSTAGLNEVPVAQEVWFDIGAPSTFAAATQGNGAPYVFSTWTNSSSVNVTLTCTDFGFPNSGCNATRYCIDSSDSCVPDTLYSTPVQVASPGVSFIRYSSVDGAGNVGPVGSSSIAIEAPACQTSADQDSDQTISLQEILAHIEKWNQGSVTLVEMLTTISLWQTGEGC